MGKRRFGWVRDADEPVAPPPERRSGRERDEHADRALALTDRLASTRPEDRALLPLEPELLDALAALDRVPDRAHGAVRRQRLRIAALLRAADLDAIEAELGANAEAVRVRDEALAGLVDWRERLIEGGDDALQAFLERYPHGDRQRLRQLAQSARRDPTGRAPKQLMRALREAAGL